MKTYKLKMPIGKLFDFLGIDDELYNTIRRIDRTIKIKTVSGKYVSINGFIKKQGYVRTYNYKGGSIRCDENHKIKQFDTTFSFIKNTNHLMVNGVRTPIISKSKRILDDVYDIAIDFPHEYITASGVESHNTTLAKILKNTIECDSMYVNASDKGGVDFIRNDIIPFAGSVGFKKLKIVVLDECLDENTLVTILRGGNEIQLPIKNVDEKNDLVKSYNVKKKQWQYRPFYLWDKGEQDVYEIELENGEIVVCTEDHKWYVEDEHGQVKIIKTNQLNKYNHILSPM